MLSAITELASRSCDDRCGGLPTQHRLAPRRLCHKAQIEIATRALTMLTVLTLFSVFVFTLPVLCLIEKIHYFWLRSARSAAWGCILENCNRLIPGLNGDFAP
jgi:hypothetical protein